MARTNDGHVSTIRSNTAPGTTGVVAVTTVITQVLAEPSTGAPRYVSGASRIVNYSADAVEVTLYYVPTGVSAADAHIVGKHSVAAKDYVLIGEINLITGYRLMIAAASNSKVNVIFFHETLD